MTFQQVMKFAESSQEIKVRPTPMKTDPIGLTPGRRRANRVCSSFATKKLL